MLWNSGLAIDWNQYVADREFGISKPWPKDSILHYFTTPLNDPGEQYSINDPGLLILPWLAELVSEKEFSHLVKDFIINKMSLMF